MEKIAIKLFEEEMLNYGRNIGVNDIIYALCLLDRKGYNINRYFENNKIIIDRFKRLSILKNDYEVIAYFDFNNKQLDETI